MKNNNIYTKGCQWSCVLLLSFFLGGCLHESPELTADGEMGVDPTSVLVNATMNLDLNLENMGIKLESEETKNYLHRFVAVAYLNRQPAYRATFVEEITDRTHLKLPLQMKLHARDYQLVVWSDFVKKENPEQDYLYQTDDLVPVIPVLSAHTGNTPFKEVFTLSQPLKLSQYRQELNKVVPIELNLEHPMARYELVANDVKTFLQKINQGEIKGQSFKARIKYSDYLPEGFNALDGVPKHSLLYMQYVKTIEMPIEEIAEMTLAFDYVFIDPAKKETRIPVEIEIINENNETIARNNIRIPCYRSNNIRISGNFLTKSSEDDGVGIDPDFDGEVDLDVEITPLHSEKQNVNQNLSLIY